MQAKPVTMLIALSLIWGASFMFIKVMLEETGPVAVGWLRMGMGALLLIVVVGVRGLQVPREPRYWAAAVVIGVVASAVPLVLIPWGEQEIDSNLAAILNSGMPLFTAIFAHLAITEERLTPARALGLLVGFAGVAIVIGPDLFDLGAAGTRGQLAIILATVGYAAGAVISRRLISGVDSTVLAASQITIAFIVVTPLLLATEGAPAIGDFSSRVLLATLGLGLGGTGVGYLLYFWLIAHTDATRTALVTYLLPVTAIGWGWLILNEGLEPAFVPGLALIIAGIFLVSRRTSSAEAISTAVTATGGED